MTNAIPFGFCCPANSFCLCSGFPLSQVSDFVGIKSKSSISRTSLRFSTNIDLMLVSYFAKCCSFPSNFLHWILTSLLVCCKLSIFALLACTLLKCNPHNNQTVEYFKGTTIYQSCFLVPFVTSYFPGQRNHTLFLSMFQAWNLNTI